MGKEADHQRVSHLVLSLKEKQKVFVGDNIEVSITSVRGNIVKVLFSAPKEVSIMREDAIVKHSQKSE